MKALALFLLLAAAGLLVAVTPASAEVEPACFTRQTIKVSGLITVTDVQVCRSGTDEYGEIGDVGTVKLSMSIPNVASAPTITVTANTPVGCTLGTATTRTLAGTSGAQHSYTNQFTATDTTCVVSLRAQVTIVATVVFDEDFTFSAHCTCAIQRLQQSGNWVIQDDANGWAVNAALSGTVSTLVSGGLTVTLAPGGSLQVTGIPDTQQEIQAIADAIAAGIPVTLNGNVGVDVLDDTTNDGKLTTPAVDLDATFNNATFEDTVGAVLEEWVPLVFFALIFVAAGFIPFAPVRLTLMGLAAAGIFASWLDVPGFGVRGVVALLGAIGIGYAGIITWRNREGDEPGVK